MNSFSTVTLLKNLHEIFTDIEQEASKQGASANEWASTISKIVGGKAGGKAPTSIGNGTSAEKVDEALDAARKYLECFHL